MPTRPACCLSPDPHPICFRHQLTPHTHGIAPDVSYIPDGAADSHCPTWAGNLDGQANLRDAVRRTATYCPTPGGKLYKLRDETAPGAAPLATLLFR